MNINEKFLPFSLPLIGDEEIAEVIDAIKSDWITTGPKVKQFEKDFSEYIGCKHAIAVNSCTGALHLALEAVGIKEGDEVITTPMTFAATAEVIRYFKAKPVFVDIDPIKMNIDVTKLEDVISIPNNKIKAIIPVHYGGYPCEMDSIMDIANRCDIKVIEDAAHALPAYYKERIVGAIGDITCFSFYATKNITTGEGGMIATDNDEWAERMRIMSLHGISADTWKRYTAEGNWYYEIIAPGYKYNFTDIAAALGIVQLKRADSFWKRRINIAGMYNEAFRGVDAIETPEVLDKDNKHSWQLYVIKLKPECLTIDRNRFIEELKNRGIGTSVHFIPLHMHPYYIDTYGYKPEDFPVAYECYRGIISLPIYPKMSDDDVERVIDAVLDVVKQFRR